MSSLIETVRTAISTGGIQKTELAEEAGVHRNSLAGIDRSDWNPRYRTLEQLGEAVERIKQRRQ